MTKFIDVSKEINTEKEETVFTLVLIDDKFIKANDQPYNYDKVIYLGTKYEEDYFAAYNNDGFMIYKGIKGTEFNNQ